MSVRNFFSSSGGGAGTNLYDSGTDTSSALNSTIEARAEGFPGDINIEGEVRGKLGVGVNGILNERDNNIEIRLEIGHFHRNDLRDALDGFLSEAMGQISNIPSGVSSGLFDVGGFPRVADITPAQTSVERDLWAGVRGGVFGIRGNQRVTGQTPVEYSFSLDYPTAKVPVFGDMTISQLTSDLPPIPVTVQMVPKEFIQNLFSSTIGEYPTVELEIPAEAVFEPVEIEIPDIGGPCSERFSEINGDIRSLRQDTESTVSGLEESEQTLESVMSELISAFGAGSISELDPRDINIRESSLDGDRLSELRQRVQSSRAPGEGDVRMPSELGNRVSGIRDRVGGIAEDCAEAFRSDLDDIGRRLNGSEGLGDRVADIKSRLSSFFSSINLDIRRPCRDRFSDLDSIISSIESRVESVRSGSVNVSSIRRDIQDARNALENIPDSREGCFDQFQSRIDNILGDIQNVETNNGLSCSDAPRAIRSRVGGYESEVQEFMNRDIRLLSGDRFKSLRDEGDSVKEAVRDEVSDDNPCKQKLLSRVESKRGDIQEFWNQSQDNVGCGQRYTSVSESVQTFRERVAGVEPAQNPREAMNLVSEGQRLLSRVNDNVERSRCYREFTNELRTAMENLGTSRGEIRILGEGDLPETDRQKAVEEIRANIASTISEVEPPEMPSLPNDGENLPNQGDNVPEVGGSSSGGLSGFWENYGGLNN